MDTAEAGDNKSPLRDADKKEAFHREAESRMREFRFKRPQGVADGVVGEYGSNEGILIPRNSRYWFETADPKQEAHLLHVNGHTQPKVGNSRVNVDPINKGYASAVRMNFPVGENHNIID